MTDAAIVPEAGSLHSGFDVRLVGQRNTLSVDVRRRDDDIRQDIICDLSISKVVGRDTHVDPILFRVVAPTCDRVSEDAIRLVTEHGHKIRNLTRFRYEMESSVGYVDAAIRHLPTDVPSPKETVLSESIRQIERMIEELPLDVSGHVGRMMLDTFRSAVCNVIKAAYDTGYRNGTADMTDDGTGNDTPGIADTGGRDASNDMFDYEWALSDVDLDDIML